MLSAAPKTTLWRGPGPSFEPGMGDVEAGTLTTRPPYLLKKFVFEYFRGRQQSDRRRQQSGARVEPNLPPVQVRNVFFLYIITIVISVVDPDHDRNWILSIFVDLDPDPYSGSKFNVFGSTTLIVIFSMHFLCYCIHFIILHSLVIFLMDYQYYFYISNPIYSTFRLFFFEILPVPLVSSIF